MDVSCSTFKRHTHTHARAPKKKKETTNETLTATRLGRFQLVPISSYQTKPIQRSYKVINTYFSDILIDSV